MTQPSPNTGSQTAAPSFLFPTQDIFHCQIMDGNLSRNLETYFPLIGRALLLNWLLCDHGAGGTGRGPSFLTPAGDEGLLSAYLVLCCQKAAGRAALGTTSDFFHRSHPDCTGARAA